MKPSNYNFFFPYEPDENKLIAYNSFSNATALIDKDKYELFMDYCNHGTAIGDEEFVSQLKAGCFVVEDNVNELEFLKLRMLSSRFATNSLGLTIAPTADCNFRCPYCYEKDVLAQVYMSEEVQDRIVKLLEAQVKTISSFSVTWYGGEPLMAIDVVERLSRKFIEICEAHDVTYGAGMITNGYLLTPDIARLLKELKVNFLQITLDGDKEVHDVRRPLVDGSGSFDTIISNMVAAKEDMPFVSIRINVDRHNIQSAKHVATILRDKGLSDKVKAHLGKITADNGSYNKSSCFDVCDFSREEAQYYSDNFDDEMYLQRYPSLVSNVCAADKFNAHIIAADGRLYKCWSDIGRDDRCVGSLLEQKVGEVDPLLRYMLHDPTADEQCKSCNLLPVCMGGCPYKRLNGETDKCSIYKYQLESFLGPISKALKIKKDQKEVV